MTQEERNIKSKTEIVTATIKEFAQHGFEDALLNRICRDNNISKGKMYHYYHSKEELFCECVNYIFHMFCLHIENFKIDKSISVFENLHNYYKNVLDYWGKNPEHYIVLNMSVNTFNRNIELGVQQGRKEYIAASKKKLVEIINVEKNNLSFSDEEKFSVIRAVNENIFTFKFAKVIDFSINKDYENAKALGNELLNFYDRLIQIFLYGVLPR